MSKKWTLDDGTVVTLAHVMETTGYSRSVCYSRLMRHKDPAKIYAKIHPKRQLKDYHLDDGSVWTSKTLAKHLGCSISTASTRLSVMSPDSKRVLQPFKNPTWGEDDYLNSKQVKKMINSRMYFDPLGHWNLINKYV